MEFARPFTVVTTSVDGDVLCALALADAWFTPGRLHRTIARHSEDGVRRALRRLAGQGVVLTQHAGSATLYRLNRDHLAAEAIDELARLRGKLVSRLSSRLRDWTVPPVLGVLFCSAARETMTLASDIDIFLVRPEGLESDRDVWTTAVMALEADVSGWTGNDARVFELEESHIREHATAEPVLMDVVDGGIALVGDLHWLAQLVTRARLDA
jgi:predicted nucleotidyltransferase